MKNVGWRFFCLVPILVSLGLAEEVVSPNDLKTDKNQAVVGRTGAVYDESAETIAISEANHASGASKGLYQSPLDGERFPDQNEYEYVLKHYPNVRTTDGVSGTDLSPNQVLVSGTDNQEEHLMSGTSKSGEVGLLNAYSRIIPHNEHIWLHKIPGATNVLTCSREGELHNFWSSNYDCLVCACIRDTGVLRPICASCAGCRVPSPEPYTEMPLIPLTVRPATIPPPYIEEVTCKPLPRDQPFENPLHPCQVCICIETLNAYGMPDVQIQCQENPQCVLPPDTSIIPIVPDDVPVHSHSCDKFPLNVVFPHPSDSCKMCRCSVQLTALGQPDKLMTCVPNPECIPEIITEIPEPYPVTPDIIPITPEPFWPSVIPPGPLPGPSPHDSCRPYVPNQPFEHPWDECQMCVCTEAFAEKHVTVEINCFTKKSCCAETQFDVISSATLAPAPYQLPEATGKLQFQDTMCEYKTFGVEFPHPNELCVVCTCEIQGRLITPFCKRSSNPECTLISAYPTAIPILDDLTNSLSGSSLYSEGFGGMGSSGLSGNSQSSVDPINPNYDQWNLQKFKRPGDYQSPVQTSGGQNFHNLGDSSLVYGLQNLQKPGNQFVQNQRPQNYYPGSGYSNGQGYLGYPQGFFPSSESTAQAHAHAQSSASASTSATASTGQNLYGYAPGSQYPGQAQPGLRNRVWGQPISQSSASAHASSKTSIKPRGKSGNPDDNKPEDNEN